MSKPDPILNAPDWPELASWAESVTIPRVQLERCARYRKALERIARMDDSWLEEAACMARKALGS